MGCPELSYWQLGGHYLAGCLQKYLTKSYVMACILQVIPDSVVEPRQGPPPKKGEAKVDPSALPDGEFDVLQLQGPKSCESSALFWIPSGRHWCLDVWVGLRKFKLWLVHQPAAALPASRANNSSSISSSNTSVSGSCSEGGSDTTTTSERSTSSTRSSRGLGGGTAGSSGVSATGNTGSVSADGIFATLGALETAAVEGMPLGEAATLDDKLEAAPAAAPLPPASGTPQAAASEQADEAKLTRPREEATFFATAANDSSPNTAVSVVSRDVGLNGRQKKHALFSDSPARNFQHPFLVQ